MLQQTVRVMKNAAPADVVTKALGTLTESVSVLKTELGGQVKEALDATNALGVRLDKIEARGNRIGEGPDKVQKSLGSLALEGESIKAVLEGKSLWGRAEINAADLIIVRKTGVVGDSFGNSPSYGFPVNQQRLPQIFDGTNRRLGLFDVIEMGRTTSNAVEYVRSDDVSNDAEIQVAEGEQKAEQSFAFVLGTAPVRTFAITAEVSRQVLADAGAGLRRFIDTKLSYNVRELFERQIITGSSSLVTGLIEIATIYAPVAATSRADKIGEVVTALLDREQAGELVVILNPYDWFAIASERTSGSGEYVNGGGWRTPANGPLWGATVVTSSALSVGTALVFWSGALGVWLRQDVTVETGYVDDQFRRNMLTVLCELRAAVGHPIPGLIYKVSF